MKKSQVNEEKKFFNQIFKESGEKYFVNDWLINYLNFSKTKFSQRQKQCVLDMGCGVGRHSFQLARLGYRVTGLDVSTQGIFLAKKKIRENNLKVRFICRDIQETGLAENYFDKIIFIDSLHHFFYGGFDGVLGEVKRLLKPGGQLILAEPNHLHPFNFASFNLGHFFKKHFDQTVFGKIVTKNERSLKNPYQLLKLFESDYQLIKFEFFRYFQFISKEIPVESNFIFRQIHWLNNRFSLILPTLLKCDHFMIKLRKRQ